MPLKATSFSSGSRAFPSGELTGRILWDALPSCKSYTGPLSHPRPFIRSHLPWGCWMLRRLFRAASASRRSILKNIQDSDTGREKETKYPASPFIFQRLIPYVPRPKLIKGWPQNDRCSFNIILFLEKCSWINRRCTVSCSISMKRSEDFLFQTISVIITLIYLWKQTSM